MTERKDNLTDALNKTPHGAIGTPTPGDENKHAGLPVHGYKPQSTEAVAMVNRNKQIEESLLRICDSMKVGRNEYSPFDQRWVSIAVTHFEQGFMALNRAIFNPERIKLAHDTNELPEGMTEGDVRG